MTAIPGNRDWRETGERGVQLEDLEMMVRLALQVILEREDRLAFLDLMGCLVTRETSVFQELPDHRVV